MRHPVFKLIVVALTLIALAVPFTDSALAQAAKPQFTNPLGGTTTFTGLIETIVRFMLGLVGVLALGSLIWGGVLYIVSFGNDGYIKQAKTIIFWAIAGLVVVTLGYVIIATVSRFLGVSL